MWLILPLLLLVAIMVCRAYFVLYSVKSFSRYWKEQAAAPQQSDEFCYVAIGDSAAQGIGATSPRRGYVGLIAARISQYTGRQVRIINLSVSGARVHDALRTQMSRLQSLACTPDLITIAIGSNDMKTFNAKDFEADMLALLAGAPKESVVLEISTYFKEQAFEANKIIRRLAKQQGVRVAAFESREFHFTWRDYSGDFFHPSNSGYKKWAAALWVEIEPLLTIRQ